MSTLAHAEIRSDHMKRICDEVDQLDEAAVRNLYVAIRVAFNKMFALASQQVAAGNPAGAVLTNGLIAIQREQARICDEPSAWERMEKP